MRREERGVRGKRWEREGKEMKEERGVRGRRERGKKSRREVIREDVEGSSGNRGESARKLGLETA